MTNTILIVTLIVTNWVQVPGDFKHKAGTNYVHEVQVVETNTFAYEIMLCTNRTMLRQDRAMTNGVARWRQAGLPPLPNNRVKE